MNSVIISIVEIDRDLLDSIAAEAEVILLDFTENIQERITTILGNYSNLSNIHFVLPERDGDRSNTELARLTEKGLESDRDRLSSWLQGQSLLGLRQSFAEDTTIFFHEFNPQTKTFNTPQELAIADSLAVPEARHISLKSEELNNSLNTKLALEDSNEWEHGMVTTDLDDNLSITSQILFIDSQVEDYQTLATGVIPGTEVVILDADKDSIKQISAVLSQRPQVASIHIVSHGSPGCLYLGNSQLNLHNIESYASDLQSWFARAYLPRGGGCRRRGQLILYGCNVAAGDAGIEFVEKLQTITKTNIAVSNSLTGSAFLGGNWNLEVQVGEILTKKIFSPQVLANYQGILNTPTSLLNLTEQSSKYSVRLKSLSTLLSQQLTTWFSQEDFLTQAAIPFGSQFGSNTWNDNALALQESIFNGTYSIRLEVRSASEMKGALGAYSSTGTTNEATIYLNGDWLETASNESISAVLLEELGHDFDRRLNNGEDSQGDEGQLFASMVGNRVLSAEERASIASENDSGLLRIDGQDVAVEFATVNINNGNLNFNTPVNKVGNGTQQGNIVLYTGVYAGVDAIITTTQVAPNITISSLDSTATGTNNVGNQARFFSPQLTGTTAANGTGATFNIQFIEAGSYNNTTNTGTPITLQNFKLNSYDIDIRQFQTFGGFNAASLILGGQLSYSTAPASGVTTFSSNSTNNLTGDVTTTQNGRVQVTYDEASSINLTMGSNDYSQVSGLAYFFLEFGQGQSWSPTTLSVPKLDLDSNDSSTATGANYQTTFTENDSAVPIADADTTITDADDTNIESATITLTNAQASDLLAAGTLPAGITASAYNPATGVITLTGSATLANYQTAIRAITFNNTSDNPSTTPRSVTVVVRDGDFNSNTATTTINVTAVNDAPVVDLNGTGTTGLDYSATFTENGGAVNVANSSIADAADPEDNITRLNFVVGGSTNDVATETVSIGGQSFTLNANKTVTASVGGTSLNLAYTASTRTFSITNSAGGTTTIPQANLDTLLRGITYNNSSENPTTGNRTLSFTATDANNATSTAAVSTITVNAVNDAPVLDLDANDSSTATGANYQNKFSFNGSAIAIADTDTTITDADDTNIESATITLTNRPNGTSESLSVLGTLPTGITASAYNSSTGVITLTGSASLANYQTAINQIVYNNTALTGRVTVNRTINVVVNDGNTNSNTATTTIDVSLLDNSVPAIDLDGNNSSGATGNNYQTTFTENGTAVSIADSDISITDLDDTNIESATITLTNRPNGTSESLSVLGTLPTGITASAYNSTTGVITLTGAATLANYQTAIRAITFNNTSDNPSTTPRSVSVVVNDGNNNSNTATTTINVTAVNDPPVVDLNGTGTTGINYSTTFTENGAPVNVADGLNADAADPEDNITSLSIVVGGSTNDVAAEDISIGGQSFTLNANRTVTASVGGTTLNLTYTASNRTFAITNNAGSTTPIPQANLDTLLRGITYNNSRENPTAGDRTFSFTATDANNATSTAAVSTITVNAVNDAPVLDLDANNSTATGANYQTSFTENGTAVSIADSDISISDLDNTNIASATITLTNAQASDLLAAGTLPTGITASAYNSTTGVITLSGSATLANYQTAIRAITFSNTSDNPNTTARSVSVVVNDGNNNSNTAISTINVIPAIKGTDSSETRTGSSGNDVIIGYKGQDILTGAGGNDRFYYNQTSEGVDIITDFDTNGDLLDFRGIIDGELSGVTFTANPFNDGYVEAVSFGSHTMIQVDFNLDESLYNKDVVLLKDVTYSTISASDFIFS